MNETKPAPKTAAIASESANVGSEPGFHPLAEVFSVMDNEHLQVLANDIAEHGLLEPIVRHEGKILDGRCRWLACKRAGVAPKFRDYAGGNPLAFVIGQNVHRRHLSKGQRLLAAARAANLPIGANQNTPGLPIGAAAKVFEVSVRNIARAKVILQRGAPELVQAVESGQVAVSRAAKLCELAAEQQNASLQEMAERKRHPQKNNKPPAVGNENTAIGQVNEARPPERSPKADGDDIHGKRDAANVTPDNETAYQRLLAAWFSASGSVQIKFIERLMEEPEPQAEGGQ